MVNTIFVTILGEKAIGEKYGLKNLNLAVTISIYQTVPTLITLQTAQFSNYFSLQSTEIFKFYSQLLDQLISRNIYKHTIRTEAWDTHDTSICIFMCLYGCKFLIISVCLYFLY